MKKIAYLTSQNVEEKKKEWFAKLDKKHWKPFVSSKAALLVIDIQNYFTNPASHAFVPSMPFIKQNILKLVGAFKRRNLPVCFTTFARMPGEKDPIQEWWGQTVEQGSKEAELNMATEAEDIVLVKPGYSAFYRTNLEEQLQKRGVDTVVITGVLSNLCCETTARDAFNRGYKVYFVVDATAAYSEELHVATLLNLSYGFATPLSTQDLCSMIV